MLTEKQTYFSGESKNNIDKVGLTTKWILIKHNSKQSAEHSRFQKSHDFRGTVL